MSVALIADRTPRSPWQPRGIGWTVLVPLVGMVALWCSPKAYADDKKDFAEGVKLLQQRRYEAAIPRLKAAVAQSPNASNERVVVDANNISLYTPHFYLTLALMETGDCATAMAHWRISQRQKVAKLSTLAVRDQQIFQVKLDRCERRLATGSGATAPPQTPRERAAAAIERAATAYRNLDSVAIPSAARSTVASDQDLQFAREGAARNLQYARDRLIDAGDDEAKINAALRLVASSETFSAEALRLLTSAIERAEAATVPNAAGEPVRATSEPTRPAAQSEAPTLDETPARDQTPTTQQSQQAPRLDPPTPTPAGTSTAQPAPNRQAASEVTPAVERAIASPIGEPPPAEITPDQRSTATNQNETSPTGTAGSEVVSGAAPEAQAQPLVTAIQDYFAGHYEATVAALGDDEFATEPQIQAQLLFRAAARFALDRIEPSQDLKRLALADVQQLKQLQAPPPSADLFSPAFLAFFAQAGN